MQYTFEEEKKVIKQLDRHVVLMVSCFYLLSFLDRSSESAPTQGFSSIADAR